MKKFIIDSVIKIGLGVGIFTSFLIYLSNIQYDLTKFSYSLFLNNYLIYLPFYVLVGIFITALAKHKRKLE
jgi:hypothetical protein